LFLTIFKSFLRLCRLILNLDPLGLPGLEPLALLIAEFLRLTDGGPHRFRFFLNSDPLPVELALPIL